MKSEPAKATPMSIPSIATIGRTAFGRTCLRITRALPAPFA